MTDDAPEYGLVMPFVVCASNGGPYEDSAFVAGAQYGEIAVALRALTTWTGMVHSDLVPQIDLLAMHHEVPIAVEPWDEHPDEWSRVTVGLAAPTDQGEGA